MKRLLFIAVIAIAASYPSIAQLSPGKDEVVLKDFIVIYYQKIGFTDHSVTLNNTRYQAGSKLPVLRYAKSKSGEQFVVVLAKSGKPEEYPLKHFTGGYESAGHIVTVRWDTAKNHITGRDTNDEKLSRAYHLLIHLLNNYIGVFLCVFSGLVLLLSLLKLIKLRGGSWWFATLGYAFIFLGSMQGRLYGSYIHAYDQLDWFALNASLPTKTGYDVLNILLIPLTIGFLFSIPIELFRALTKNVSKPPISSVDRYSYSGDYSSDTTVNPESAKVNPLFNTKKIDKATFSDDRILRNTLGGKIGRLEKAILSNDQIIRDSNGKKAGRIEQSIWDKDKQIIRNPEGKKEGEIKTNIWGERIIVDISGKEIGKIEKNFWGETEIKKK